MAVGRGRLKCDGTRDETRFRLSAKRTSPFKSAGASVQSTAGSRGVRISGSYAGYTVFRGSVKGTGCPLHSPVTFILRPLSSSGTSIMRIFGNLTKKTLKTYAGLVKRKCRQGSPFLQATKALRVSRGIALLFHDRGTRRGWGSAPRPDRLYPQERPGTHFTGGWVGLRAGLDGPKISPPPGFDAGPSSP